jgi:hypothetical protein
MAGEGISMLQAAETIHWFALAFMGTVYTLRLFWLLRFKPGKDRQAPGERFGNTTVYPALYSLANVAMPWAMESTRRDFAFWLNFVVFHVCAFSGIFFAIISSAYRPFVEVPVIGSYFLTIFTVGFVVGAYRVYRRIKSPVLRLISSPDDYFAMGTLTVWFALGVPATASVLGRIEGEGIMVAFLLLTSFFLFYVPFSKISHYLYYPFSRYYIGKTLGRRGSMPSPGSRG